MPLSVVLRADAGIEIGSGHVMRCLTLARALAAAGAACRFVCRDLPGHLGERIAAQGFAVDLLSEPDQPRSRNPETTPAPPHAAWLPLPQAEDARQTRAALADAEPDWIIVDHYALDALWERAVSGPGTRLMALDDLADRPHGCDLLLDQNLGRRGEDYDGLVPASARRLIGPRFALVQPDFAARRPASLARRARPRLERLLVAMGGVDRENATGTVLDALAGPDMLGIGFVDVVLGSAAPWHGAVRERLATLSMPAALHIDTPRMAELMEAADLAVGAGGTTSWERCCLGLPSLVLVLADNQVPAVRALAAAGAAADLGRPTRLDIAERLREKLRAVANPSRLSAMSQAAAELVDGGGSARVVKVLSEMPR